MDQFAKTSLPVTARNGNRMQAILIALFLSLSWFSLSSCNNKTEHFERASYDKCSELEGLCETKCSQRKFRSCYVDKKRFGNGPYDVTKQCHGVHVGDMCYPCDQIFSLSFGGAMRAVSCEEFVQSLLRKNKECGGCLKAVGEVPLDLAELD